MDGEKAGEFARRFEALYRKVGLYYPNDFSEVDKRPPWQVFKDMWARVNALPLQPDENNIPTYSVIYMSKTGPVHLTIQAISQGAEGKQTPESIRASWADRNGHQIKDPEVVDASRCGSEDLPATLGALSALALMEGSIQAAETTAVRHAAGRTEPINIPII